MRTLTSFLLTALICINLFGFYAMFIVRQTEVKEEMSESVNMPTSTNQREVISFTKTEFSQLYFNDDGKEFRLNGRLYDVVSIEKSGNKVNITVEYDSKETDLVEAFGGLFSQQQGKDQNSSPLKTVISHFQQDYITLYNRIYSFNKLSFIGRCMVNNSYPSSSFVADNLTPPPQFFLV
jgi:hypothetical protein